MPPLFEEKRKMSDRRQRDDGPPLGCRERRGKRDRRQTAISEISFQEWTRYLLRFKKRAMEKAEARQMAAVKPRSLKSENDPGDTPDGHS